VPTTVLNVNGKRVSVTVDDPDTPLLRSTWAVTRPLRGGGPTAKNCALRRCRSSNMASPAENVLAFYDKRYTCEQWIKEGKGARPVRVTLPA
jgi:hypothetical protein